MSEFALRSGGSKYLGWTSIEVTRSIEELASSFSVELTDLWNDGRDPVPLVAGDEVVVDIDDTKLITGYIDNDSLDYDATRRTLGFSGRSKTADLVDCSAIHEGGQWRNQNIQRIAEDVCFPFEIDVVMNIDEDQKFRRFSVQEGETAFATLDRAARMRGILMTTDGDGRLVFDRASTIRIGTTLEYGVNILRGAKRNSWQDLHSIYIVKTQAAGDDTTFGNASAGIKRSASNTDIVPRYRPTIIMAENEDTGVELQKRADWERNVRYGRARRLDYTVRGWEHDDGLWEPNRIVRVIDPNARVDDDLLIVSTTQTRSNRGTFTRLSLAGPEAYDVLRLNPPKKRTDF